MSALSSDPKYATAWPGVGNRITQLKIEHRVQMFVCSVCASLVIDQEVHTGWHREIKGSGPNG